MFVATPDATVAIRLLSSFRRKGGNVATSHPFVLSDLSFLLETPATTLSVRKLSLSIQSSRCVLHRAPNAFENSVEEKLLYLDIYLVDKISFFFYVGELSSHRRTKEKSTGNNAKNSSNVPGTFHSMGNVPMDRVDIGGGKNSRTPGG